MKKNESDNFLHQIKQFAELLLHETEQKSYPISETLLQSSQTEQTFARDFLRKLQTILETGAAKSLPHLNHSHLVPLVESIMKTSSFSDMIAILGGTGISALLNAEALVQKLKVWFGYQGEQVYSETETALKQVIQETTPELVKFIGIVVMQEVRKLLEESQNGVDEQVQELLKIQEKPITNQINAGVNILDRSLGQVVQSIDDVIIERHEKIQKAIERKLDSLYKAQGENRNALEQKIGYLLTDEKNAQEERRIIVDGLAYIIREQKSIDECMQEVQQLIEENIGVAVLRIEINTEEIKKDVKDTKVGVKVIRDILQEKNLREKSIKTLTELAALSFDTEMQNLEERLDYSKTAKLTINLREKGPFGQHGIFGFDIMNLSIPMSNHNIIEFIKRHQGQVIILQANGGMGKTIVLTNFAYLYITRDNAAVAVIRCNQFVKSSGFEEAMENDRKFREYLREHYCEGCKLTDTHLFLDGLDEFSSSHHQNLKNRILGLKGKCKGVLATRVFEK